MMPEAALADKAKHRPATGRAARRPRRPRYFPPLREMCETYLKKNLQNVQDAAGGLVFRRKMRKMAW
jgi:hypothetical protein